MFSKPGRRITFFFLFSCNLLPGFLLSAQVESALHNRAFEILQERGEIVIEFHPEDISALKKVNSLLSVDRKTSRGYEAYANEAAFRAFLELDFPFSLIEREPLKKSAPGIQIFPGSWDVYPTHDQYIGFMMERADSFPEICRLDTIGLSVEGRNILVMKITDNPGMHEAEPAFVYSSTMHGDETTGYVLLLRLIDYLCSNYSEDSLVTRMVDNIEIWINPLANPDGTYWQGDDELLLPKRFNSNNADLNRNFPGIKDSEHPDNLDYQPENLAQMEFLRRIYMVLGANIHGGEEVINYPYDTWEEHHADNAWYMEISKEYAKEAQNRSAPLLYMSGFDEGTTNGWDWYDLEGGRQDWINYYNYAREVTMEISLDKFPLPSDLPYYWHYNYPSLLRFMEHSLYGIHGMIKDENSGKAIKASVRVLDHDKLQSHIYSDSLTGYFARPIEEGNYDLEISSPGYSTKRITNVQVTSDRTTWLDISLDPRSVGTTEKEAIRAFPNPFISECDIHFPASFPGLYQVLVFDTRGRLVLDDLIYANSGGEYIYSLEGSLLRQGIYLLKIISPEDIYTTKIFKSQ